MAAFLAVTAQNTADFTTLTENLNYRSDQLLALFPFSFNAEQAASYAGNPEGIANHLYANKFGNGDEASGDGWRYRGRGLVQIAGRDLYRRAGQPLGIDLVNDPDLLADPTVAARQALNDWQSCKCSAISDSGGITAIWRYVNGSSQVGLSTVKRRYDTYLQQLRAAQTPGSN
ncbi:glycoside hydrolase family 19 protein [Sphingomonas sp. CGMCC 1.13654]|uniref:Glycoside hydrolase family 19 protein n=2 Tax=Sphingomonas chungangi TaxID=2683589 RepID=A0A838L4L3_9SPHN|nr:glycoside hydrolase family 19 protein [Sphingomonas chungangi]MBA2933957.1 glycoside hydrolase family 19 protein [Sphingomonas chungangi]MVW57083.1 glycoside hydrolase family 19 protein [Sphingomonas chungangi]